MTDRPAWRELEVRADPDLDESVVAALDAAGAVGSWTVEPGRIRGYFGAAEETDVVYQQGDLPVMIPADSMDSLQGATLDLPQTDTNLPNDSGTDCGGSRVTLTQALTYAALVIVVARKMGIQRRTTPPVTPEPQDPAEPERSAIAWGVAAVSIALAWSSLAIKLWFGMVLGVEDTALILPGLLGGADHCDTHGAHLHLCLVHGGEWASHSTEGYAKKAAELLGRANAERGARGLAPLPLTSHPGPEPIARALGLSERRLRFELSQAGGRQFGDVTGRNIGSHLAIVLDEYSGTDGIITIEKMTHPNV